MNPTDFADQVVSASIPPGWARSRVGDIVSIIRGIGFPATAKQAGPGRGLVGCLRTTNVQASVEWDDLWYVPEQYVRSPAQIIAKDDILISLANSLNLVGKVALVGEIPERSTLGAFISALRVHRPIDPRFVYYQLTAQHSQHALREMASTTTNISNVSTTKLAQLSLRIAPLAEQQRIADRIDELFTDLAAGVAALERANRNLLRYRAALLHAAVTGRLLSSQALDWADESRWQPLGGLIGDIEQGWSPKCERDAAVRYSDWAVMTTTAIQKMAFDSAENKRLPDTLEPTPQYEVHVGDMLVTRAGPRSRCGIACLVRECRPRLILCDKAYRFRCIDSKALPEYLELALNARPITDAVERMKTGSSDSGLNLTKTRFRSLMVPLPPLPVQSAIVEAVTERLSQIDALEAEVGRGLARASRLRQSILKTAFEGRLVPQDPADEPTSVLLERIRNDRVAPMSIRRKKRAMVHE
ncbi:MAG: restriction endonuclease subunit S [Phycisphaerales bacterium]